VEGRPALDIFGVGVGVQRQEVGHHFERLLEARKMQSGESGLKKIKKKILERFSLEKAIETF
jgi:hypothetical protein